MTKGRKTAFSEAMGLIIWHQYGVSLLQAALHFLHHPIEINTLQSNRLEQLGITSNGQFLSRFQLILNSFHFLKSSQGIEGSAFITLPVTNIIHSTGSHHLIIQQ
jgi:hypothetical protein